MKQAVSSLPAERFAGEASELAPPSGAQPPHPPEPLSGIGRADKGTLLRARAPPTTRAWMARLALLGRSARQQFLARPPAPTTPALPPCLARLRRL